ncbi:MAG: response regulator [Burkholderiales bacterium]|nr:response regulator [Opitutaceae bacterium]
MSLFAVLAPKRLALRLLLVIGLATGSILIGMVWLHYRASRDLLITQARAEALKQVHAAAASLDATIGRVAALPRSLAAYQEAVGPEPSADLIPFLAKLLAAAPREEVFGCYIAFDAKTWTDPLAMRWVDRKSWPHAATIGYDFHDAAQDWYNGPKASRVLHVTEPFFDAGGSDVTMVSVTHPILDREGRYIGTAGADMSLDGIHTLTARLHLRAEGEETSDIEDHAFLVSRGGRLIAHPDASLLVSRERAEAAHVSALPAGQQILAAPTGSAVLPATAGDATHHARDEHMLFWAQAPVTGWKVALSVPTRVILAPVRQLAIESALIGAAGLLGMLVVVALAARRVVRPLRQLRQAARQIESGRHDQFNYLAPLASGRDELAELAGGFLHMATEIRQREARLAEWNQNLEHTVAERTAALAATEAQARKLALVASRTHNGVLITGPDGRIEWVNDGFTRITGYTAEDAVGRHPDSFLMGPDTAPETLAEKNRARAEKRGFQIEILNYHKSGRRVWIAADAQPVFDDSGAVVHYIVVQTDITKRKQSEAELHLARDAAEEANRTKSAFLANMSHELRTPMNAIIGYSEMLMEEAEDTGHEDAIPDLKKIHSAGKHLLGLINDVLDLSKIEAGKMTLYLEDAPLPALVDEVASTIRPLVAKNNNTLVLETAPDLGLSHADVTKVRQTLFNLLSNAAKFTHDGRITLTVARTSRDSRDWIDFRVSDTGIGMTEAQLGKLFQAFVQADDSTTRKYGGTGLGLAISRRFCQLMGGDITVTSAPGQGTVFTASIPARVSETGSTATGSAGILPASEKSAPPASSDRGTGVPPVDGEASRLAASSADAAESATGPVILAVDDDPTVLELLSRNLVREGYAVRTAATGREALALARELRPRLITLDVMMPSLDGWSVLTALKAAPATRDIPVVMLSMVDDKPLGFALGAADYLNKPIDRTRLLDVLARHAPRDAERLALVIDDLPDNRAMLRHALEREGWTVAEATDGHTGLAEVAAQKPALILLDLMMPGMDGFAFLRALRATPRNHDIPVVVVTAKELTPEDRDQLHAAVQNIVQIGTLTPESLLAEIHAKITAASPMP